MVGQRIALRTSTLLLLALAGCDRGDIPPAPAAPRQTPASAATSAPTDAAVEVAVDGAVDGAVDAALDVAPLAVGALPAVRVANIGMHIGGGPNDDVTKAPIQQSVAPHFDEFKACFALLDSPSQVELGVDLTIEAAGGKAKVSHPRSTAPGTALRDCGVRVFESIEFLKPKTGKTIVSYSLRFSPEKP